MIMKKSASFKRLHNQPYPRRFMYHDEYVNETGAPAGYYRSECATPGGDSDYVYTPEYHPLGYFNVECIKPGCAAIISLIDYLFPETISRNSVRLKTFTSDTLHEYTYLYQIIYGNKYMLIYHTENHGNDNCDWFYRWMDTDEKEPYLLWYCVHPSGRVSKVRLG
jgi:hypothetical protein